MPKIVDIRFIAGRRRQVIEQEKAVNDIARKIAEHRYAAWRKRERSSTSFEEWVVSYSNPEESIKKLFREEQEQKKILDEWKSYGETVPLMEKKEEVSLEQQILDLLNDGWELKGEITSMPTANKWLQTLVKYESNSAGDLLGPRRI